MSMWEFAAQHPWWCAVYLSIIGLTLCYMAREGFGQILMDINSHNNDSHDGHCNNRGLKEEE